MKEALKLALEALEDSEDQLAKPYSTDVRRAITAIKEALREHAMYEVQRLGQEIQPEQEPVAWITEKISGPTKGYMTVTFNKDTGWKDARSIPLYEHPPQRTWVGLTDDEIDQGLLRSDYAFKTAEAWRAGVVFAMTKLKEKNT